MQLAPPTRRRCKDEQMDDVEGASSFQTTGDAYDGFMGRYSRSLAAPFADAAGIEPGHTVLDVGCGPGALTAVLVSRLGADAVSAFDPSPPFVDACRARNPGVDIRLGRAEEIPFDDDVVDGALAQLVLHFVSEPNRVASELRRVVRPGGVVAACVWDFAGGMQMLRQFWDAALTVDRDAPDEAHTLRFGREGEIAALFDEAGLDQITESTLTVSSTYQSFDQLWSGFLAGIGPAGAYCLSLPAPKQSTVRDELFARVGSPAGAFSLTAMARCAAARVPL
jgi:SAM-dependent methyltransferase